MTTLACDVAIVGAGPTGLTLANILGAAGVTTIVIERNDSTVQEPRAVSIDDESLRTMQAIGLDAEVINDVAPDCGYHYFGPDGSCFVRVEPTARPYGFPRRSNFRQPLLEATLRQGATRFPSVHTRFRHVCDDATQDSHGVTLDVSPPEGPRLYVRASYVVGCDGAKSTIRRVIGANLAGSTYQQRWLIVDLAETREQLRHSRVFCNPRRPAITLAGPQGTRRYEFMLHDDEPDDMVTAPEFVRAMLAAHGPDADASIVRRQVYTFHARIADRWNEGRIFLAGDAAHLSPPFAGQGMNSGIRDAHNLGWKLADVVRGRLGPALLDSYVRERKSHALALIQMAVGIGRVMMPTSPLQAALVRWGFRIARFAPPVQSYFAEMKYKPKPHYTAGFLLPARGLPLIGRMLPQPTLELARGHRVRLDDAIGREFALVAYGNNAVRALGVAAECDFGLGTMGQLAVLPGGVTPEDTAAAGAVIVGRDADDVLRPSCRGRDLLFVVRPDRYVLGATDATSRPAMAAFAASVRTLVDCTGMVIAADIPPALQEVHT